MSRRRPRSQSDPSSAAARPAGERLQKVLAAAGIGSRRECEELITTGRVEIDRQTVMALGTRVDPLRQEIRVDGVTLPRPKRAYFVLNKPAGVVCTNRDPAGRVRAVDLVRSDERLFTVGRLDRTSEGLILITNDGELANQLTHPRYGIEKRYLVRVAGHFDLAICEKLRRGIHLAEGVARVSDIHVRKRSAKFSDVEICLREGKNREIRRVLARIGHKVLQLKRIAIGPLKLGMLPSGATRALTPDEVRQLRQATGRGPRDAQKADRPRSNVQRTKASRDKPPRDKPPRSGAPRSGSSPAKEPRRADRRPPAARAPQAREDLVPARSPPEWQTDEEIGVPGGQSSPLASRPLPDVEEVEVTDYEMDRPTGSVLGFDDEPRPTKSARTKRRK